MRMTECRSQDLGVLSLPGTGPVSEMVDQARLAAELGFDVVLLLDHLQTTAPLPPLVAIAAAVPNIRVSNLVLNTAFYRTSGPAACGRPEMGRAVELLGRTTGETPRPDHVVLS